MPIPSPGTYDQASQVTLLAVKVKTDLLPAVPASQADVESLPNFVCRQFYQRQGVVVQGTWDWDSFVNQTDYACQSDDAPGAWSNNAVQNDEYYYEDVYLQKGTWKVTVVFVKSTSGGIVEVLHGAQSFGTYDTHGFGTSYNHVATAELVVAANTQAHLRIRSTTKNASSTGYGIRYSRIMLERVI